MPTIGIDIYSHHFEKGFQNDTIGIYAVFDAGSFYGAKCSAAFGTYRNSVGNLSTHAGVAIAPNRYARLYAGIVTGYGNRAIPFVTPQLIVPVSQENDIVMSFIPKTKINASGVIHLSLETKF